MGNIESRFIEAGLGCLIMVNPSLLTRAGYVRIPQDHPFTQIEDRSIYANELCGLEVHGGVTFFGDILIEDSEEDSGLYIGFDCAHLGDAYDPELLPEDEEERRKVEKRLSHISSDEWSRVCGWSRVWTLEDVQRETRNLARQIANFGQQTEAGE